MEASRPFETKPVVLMAMKREFELAAADFAENPMAGERWARLEDAMWALQFVRQQKEQDIVDLVVRHPVSQWPSALARRAKLRGDVAELVQMGKELESHARAFAPVTEADREKARG